MDQVNSPYSKHALYDIFVELIHQQQEHEDAIQKIIVQELRKLGDEFSEELQLNVTELHVISSIGEHEPINVTALADRLRTSKATISRICSKLLSYDFIRRTQLSDNKKEVYFRLNPKGKKLNVLHERVHGQLEQRFLGILDHYDEDELLIVQKVFRDILNNWTFIHEDLETQG
ncbi:MarR family transcriptional regulator [Paenibacillus sp. MER 180]|uniref:MarR family transcriptional regulator n=1 Tax=Paenibacillus sp. MER 180 TaxID=2939570 RepID=UPI00204155AE|nr:MarR family transcriptional regulator [Paenibacillus sp. MER 180]MCM3293922.1 MarR family transcriptional regulator [Paenibacillus sp. MER 180]